MRRNWPMIVPPYSRSQSHTISTKRSRPTSSREVPCSKRCFSTAFWVEMPGMVVAGEERRLEAAHPVPAHEQVGQ